MPFLGFLSLVPASVTINLGCCYLPYKFTALPTFVINSLVHWTENSQGRLAPTLLLGRSFHSSDTWEAQLLKASPWIKGLFAQQTPTACQRPDTHGLAGPRDTQTDTSPLLPRRRPGL